jgi:3-hydroxybutyryl-CoA dehydratase
MIGIEKSPADYRMTQLGITTMQTPLYFEDLQLGDCWTSESREVTGDDVTDFAHLTGDHDRLHTEKLGSEASPFGEPIAHGLLGLSVLAGLSSTCPNVVTLALIGIRDWTFEAPIFFGDVVHAVTRVTDLARHGRRAGRVTWLRQLLNQHGRVVQKGTFVTLVSSRVRDGRDRGVILNGQVNRT